VTPGQSFSYDIVTGNAGPSTAVNVAVTDNLPAGLSYAGSVPPGCQAAGQLVTCPAISSLAPGETRQHVLLVRLSASYTGTGSDLGNQAVSQADTADPNGANNTSPPAGPPGGVSAPSADLAIAKAVGTTGTVTPGATFDYELTVTTHGPSDAAGVEVTDTLPATLTFISSVPAGCVQSGQTVTCPKAALPASGGPLSYQLTVRLDAAYTGDGSDLVNVAEVAADTADPVVANNQAALTGQVMVGPASADVAITKTPEETALVVPGAAFHYVLTVTNNGPSVAAGVVVRDALPIALSLDPADTSGCAQAGQQVTCPAITLPLGTPRVYRLTVRLDAAYSGDGTEISNQAIVSAATADPVPANNSAVAPLPGGGAAPPSADVQVTKRLLGTGPVVPGTAYSYEVTVVNAGPSIAHDVRTIDVLPSQVTWDAAADDSCVLSSGTNTIECPPVPSLAVNSPVKRTVTVTLNASYTGDGSNIVNTFRSLTATADPNPANNEATVSNVPGGVAAPSADVTMTKRYAGDRLGDPGTPIVPGETLHHVIDANNNGPSTAVNVLVTDQLPAQLAFVSSPSGCTGTPEQYGGLITCPNVPTLPAGQAGQDLGYYEILVRLNPSYTGTGSDVVNTGKALAQTSDPNLANNQATQGIPPGVGSAKADLTTVKVVTGPAQVAPGEELGFQITVTNNGPSTALQVTASDPLPAALSFVSSSDGCTAAAQNVTCPAVASVTPGMTATWAIRVKLAASYTGDGSDLGNVATGSSPTADPHPGNNPSAPAYPNVGPGKANLALAKATTTTAPVAPGETFSYQLTVTNNGTSDAHAVKVTDQLPAQLSFVSSADGCTAGVTCPEIGTLATGTSASFVFVVRLLPAYQGNGSDISNSATVSAATADPDPSDNTATAGVPGGSTAAPVADLAITAAAPPQPLAPGEMFTVLITVENLGPSTTRSPAPVVVTLPNNVLAESPLPSGCAIDPRGVLCTIAAGLDPRTEALTAFPLPMRIALTAPENTVLSGGTAVVSYPGDPVRPNDNAPWQVRTGVAQADLALVKTGSGAIDWTLTATNKGPSTAASVLLTDTLPAGISFASKSPVPSPRSLRVPRWSGASPSVPLWTVPLPTALPSVRPRLTLTRPTTVQQRRSSRAAPSP
jgi:uncharacterized repeat protein (TIGR01451 family)